MTKPPGGGLLRVSSEMLLLPCPDEAHCSSLGTVTGWWALWHAVALLTLAPTAPSKEPAWI